MTYSQYNKFRIFAENATTYVSTKGNGIIRDDDKWIAYDARKSGLLPGDFISSITLNTALRQATFMSTLLAESIVRSNIVRETITSDILSKVDDWAEPIGTALKYGYNLSTNNIKVGGNFNDTFTAQFGPDLVSATGDVIPVPVGCYRFSGYQNLNANTLVSIIPTTDSTLTFRDNDPNDARGDLYAATVQAQYGILRAHVEMKYDKSDDLSNVNDRIVTMQELKHTSWLIGGMALSYNTNLDDIQTVGNYYASTSNIVETVSNFPTFIEKYAFTLKVFYGQGTSYVTQYIRTYNRGMCAQRHINNQGSWTPWVPASPINLDTVEITKYEDFIDTKTKNLRAGFINHTTPFFNRNQIITLDVNKGFVIYPFSYGFICNAIANDDVIIYCSDNTHGFQIFFYSNTHEWISIGSSFPMGFTARTYEKLSDSFPVRHTDLSNGTVITDWRWRVGEQPSSYIHGDVAFVGTTGGGDAYANMVLDGTLYVNEGLNKVVTDNGSSGAIGNENKPVYMNERNQLLPCKYTIAVRNTIPDTFDDDTIYLLTEV